MDKDTVLNIHQAKTHLSSVLEKVAAGESIVIAKAGKPIARLVPFDPPIKKKKFGGLGGKIWVSDDFDAPLSAKVLASFEGR